MYLYLYLRSYSYFADDGVPLGLGNYPFPAEGAHEDAAAAAGAPDEGALLAAAAVAMPRGPLSELCGGNVVLDVQSRINQRDAPESNCKPRASCKYVTL